MDFGVLVIDDEIEIARALKLILSSQYTTYIADNIDKMYEILSSKEIGLVILDYDLHAKITGIELAKNVKEIYPLVQIILFTGHSEYDIIRMALNSGAINSFMNKPISKDELIELVVKNYKIWEVNYMQFNRVIENIKMGETTNLDISRFGNSLPILNLLMKESMGVKKTESPQIAGINITLNDKLMYQEFIRDDLIVHNNLLFHGFIETIHKLGMQIFQQKEEDFKRLKLYDLDLFIKKSGDLIFSIFLINLGEFNEVIQSQLREFIEIIEDKISFESSLSKTSMFIHQQMKGINEIIAENLN